MINRELIRLKTIQIVYSHYINGLNEKGNTGSQVSEKELLLSLDKAYDLYNAMLTLLTEVRRIAIEEVDFREMRNKQLGIDATVNNRFANNRLLEMLCQNEQLRDWREANSTFWSLDIETLRNIYKAFTQTADYASYLEQEDSFENDKNIIRRFYRSMLCDNEELAEALEDMSIYWNDDKYIIDTFVLKTIKLFKEDTTPDMPLLAKYEHKEDLEYATQLIHHSLDNAEYYRSLIEKYAKGWDMHRIALMDIIIIQTGLAEIIAFPTIPIAVSINEYVNISKMYSTQKNWTYVNAALDNITKQLLSEHKIIEKK